MIVPALRAALAGVPEVCRSADVDRSLLLMGERLQALPWVVADLPREQQAIALVDVRIAIADGMVVAARLFRVNGYERVALTLCGVLGSLMGLPRHGATAVAAEVADG